MVDTTSKRIKAEYIWVDGTKPTPILRSKTRILATGQEPPIWGFDGSSTNQAPGEASDCVLKPVRVVVDPVRGSGSKLVLCEVFYTDMTPHMTNTRAPLRRVAEKFDDQAPLFGLEQEYTFFRNERPLGWPETGFPGPQGPYYCSVGADSAYGREIVEEHMDLCLEAGLGFCGINAEVMPGQWEFQIGALDPLTAADDLILARWLLYRVAEKYGVTVSLDPKPVKGDWNGAGCHTNFSTLKMRESYEAIVTACEALGENANLHIQHYGAGIPERLTGLHETCSYDEFRYGVSDRGASIRIPWQCARDRKGYLEDRRPNANCDPYTVCRLIVDTCCSALAATNGARLQHTPSHLVV